MEVLERELNYFRTHKSELLEHYEGQHAVIKGTTLLGTFTTFTQAFEAGVREYGTDAFLVKRVAATDDLVQFPALGVNMLYGHP